MNIKCSKYLVISLSASLLLGCSGMSNNPTVINPPKNLVVNTETDNGIVINKVLVSFNASDLNNPIVHGWSDLTTGEASGYAEYDISGNSWKANGISGSAQWYTEPSVQDNSNASDNGWKMSWTSRIVSGTYISDYYSNGSVRFLPVLSLTRSGDLVATLAGGGTHTLVKGAGSEAYHNYAIEFNAKTKLATFSFDGVVIESSWAGESSSQNIIAWGNGSSGIDSVALYRKVSFEILAHLPKTFESTVFEGGREGANGMSRYRIPSMVQSGDGSLLAFIEGRPSGADPGQMGQINISMKRSTDKGRTWLPVQIIHKDPAFDYSDPRPFVDKTTNTVYVFYVQWPDLCAQNGNCVAPNDANYIFYRSSNDNGITWNAPVNLTAQVKNPTWRSINPGPGQGIQLQWQSPEQANHNGRLIFPAIVRASDNHFYVVSIFSDNNGVSWQTGSLTPISGPTEADMVELSHGAILLSARNDGYTAADTRFHFLSTDGGVNWTQTPHDLLVSRVDIGLTRYSAVRSGDSENRILVSAPMGSSSGPDRNNLALWSSVDEGKTFGKPYQLVDGMSGYSDIITLSDGSIGIIYEATGSTLLKFINLNLKEIK